jgi:hypothetical protein
MHVKLNGLPCECDKHTTGSWGEVPRNSIPHLYLVMWATIALFILGVLEANCSFLPVPFL